MNEIVTSPADFLKVGSSPLFFERPWSRAACRLAGASLARFTQLASPSPPLLPLNQGESSRASISSTDETSCGRIACVKSDSSARGTPQRLGSTGQRTLLIVEPRDMVRTRKPGASRCGGAGPARGGRAYRAWLWAWMLGLV